MSVEPSDRGPAAPLDSQHYKPEPSNRTTLTDSMNDSVRRYFANAPSKNNPNRSKYRSNANAKAHKDHNHYKSNADPEEPKYNKEFKSNAEPKDAENNREFKSGAAPKDSKNDREFMSNAVPLERDSVREYFSNAVSQNNPTNTNYRSNAMSQDSKYFQDHNYKTATNLYQLNSSGDKEYAYAKANNAAIDDFESSRGRTIGGRSSAQTEAAKHFHDHKYQTATNLYQLNSSGDKEYAYAKANNALIDDFENGSGRTIGGRSAAQTESAKHFHDHNYKTATNLYQLNGSGDKEYAYAKANGSLIDDFESGSGRTIGGRSAAQTESVKHFQDHNYKTATNLYQLNSSGEEEYAYAKANGSLIDDFESGNGRSIGGRSAAQVEPVKHFKDKVFDDSGDKTYTDGDNNALDNPYKDGSGRSIGGRGNPLLDLEMNHKSVDGYSDTKQGRFGRNGGGDSENTLYSPIQKNIDLTIGRDKGAAQYIQLQETLEANKVYSREAIRRYDRFNRFGFMDPYSGMGLTKEYLFFVKPDLNIIKVGTNQLIPALSTNSFFNDLINRYPAVIPQLQSSAGLGTDKQNPFMILLSNSVRNTMDLPSIQANEIETAANIYGTKINYRGSGYKSDEDASISLEFEDTKWGDVYMLLKAYEEYSRLKDVGLISPPNVSLADERDDGIVFTKYHKNRELHDRFSIYKIIVDDDYKTILYWAKAIGCYFSTVPRDSFSDLRESGGLKYTVEIKAPFIRDMDPLDLYDFNNLILKKRNMDLRGIEDLKRKYIFRSYEDDYFTTNGDSPSNPLGRGIINGEWVSLPFIQRNMNPIKEASNGEPKIPRDWTAPLNMDYLYELVWY